MKKLRSSTVEPVLGTLLDYGAMRKVRTRGLKLANNHVLLAAMAYNLKKLTYLLEKDCSQIQIYFHDLR